MNVYWTNDWNDDGDAMREECYFQRTDTIEDAKAQALANCKASNGDLGWNDTPPQYRVVPIGEADCWAKFHGAPSKKIIREFARSRGLSPKDIHIRRPGTHPGGFYTWVSISAEVFAAQNITPN